MDPVRHPGADPRGDSHAGAQHFCAVVAREGGLGPSPRLLAAGCGAGHEARHIHRCLGGTMVGIDTRPPGDGDPAEPGLRLSAASVLDLPFEDASFDGVFYHHVIEHVTDPRRSLAELRRVLRPGGLLYVGTPNRHRVVGYLGSFDASLADKVRWNAADYAARLRGRFRNELGAHAGFTEGELRRLVAERFAAVRSLTVDYFRFKYGARLPAAALRLVEVPALREVLVPSVYLMARAPVTAAARPPAPQASGRRR